MDSKKSNKITDIVRLQQILKKWKKLANASKKTTTTTTGSSGGKSTIKFFKRTLSFNDVSSSASSGGDQAVPKGYVAVCVGKEMKRYIVPTEYLGHEAFGLLLRKAEEEFGFQQEGVLKIPCEVDVFDNILNMVQNKRSDHGALLFLHDLGFNLDNKDQTLANCYSPDCELVLKCVDDEDEDGDPLSLFIKFSSFSD